MAEIIGKNVRTTQHNGEYGNQSASVLGATVNGAAINDTIYFGDIAGGNEVIRVTVYREALGADVTLDLGYRMKTPGQGADNLTAFFAATSVSAAGRTEGEGDTVIIPAGDGVELVGTVKGAATPSSDRDIKVIVERIYHGQQ